MRLKEWEVTIQKIIDECNQKQKMEDKVLMEWRAKLEKEPALLRPFQIDEIVREVRRRLSNASRWHKQRRCPLAQRDRQRGLLDRHFDLPLICGWVSALGGKLSAILKTGDSPHQKTITKADNLREKMCLIGVRETI
jgi:hypothetical protein